MGILSFLFGQKKRPTPKTGTISGSGEYAIDVVGESYYQDTLDNICGGKIEEGHRKEVKDNWGQCKLGSKLLKSRRS